MPRKVRAITYFPVTELGNGSGVWALPAPEHDENSRGDAQAESEHAQGHQQLHPRLIAKLPPCKSRSRAML